MNRLYVICLVFALFFASAAFAQQPSGIKDTSFTFYSAWQAVKKSNPDATIPVINTGDSVKEATNITYCTAGNRALKLDVFSPAKNKNKLPVVLMMFGGGWHSGNRSMHVPMAKRLAAKGFITITADYRLSTEALYPAAVNDVKTALKWIRANAKTYGIDISRIALWGFSAGGQLATLAGTTANNSLFKGDDCYSNYSDAVKAIIDVDGILAFIHPESVEGDDSKKISSARLWFGGPKSAGTVLWEQASALNHIDAHTPPVLFLNSSLRQTHAGRDDMIRKMDSLHIYSEVHAFSDAPHPFILFNPWFEPSLNYTVAFLRKVLK